MKLKNGVLHLDSSFDNEQIDKLLPKLNEKLDHIDEVVIDKDSFIASSALFSIIASLKKTKSDIKVSFFDNSSNIVGLGNVTFDMKR